MRAILGNSGYGSIPGIISHKSLPNGNSPTNINGRLIAVPRINQVKPNVSKSTGLKIGNPITWLSSNAGWQFGNFVKGAQKGSGISITKDIKNATGLGGTSGSVINTATKNLLGQTGGTKNGIPSVSLSNPINLNISGLKGPGSAQGPSQSSGLLSSLLQAIDNFLSSL